MAVLRLIWDHALAFHSVCFFLLCLAIAWRFWRGGKRRVTVAIQKEVEKETADQLVMRLLGEHLTIMRQFGALSEESRQFILKYQYVPEFKMLALTSVMLFEAKVAYDGPQEQSQC